VLGIMAATHLAIAAQDASRAPWSDTTKIRIFRLQTWRAEIDSDRRLVKGLASAHLGCNLLEISIDVGRWLGIAHDAQHAPGLVITRGQLVRPIGNACPSRRIEELLWRHIQGVAIDMGPAAD